MKTEQPTLTLYGALASGSIAVEAMLTLLGVPYALRARSLPLNSGCLPDLDFSIQSSANQKGIS